MKIRFVSFFSFALIAATSLSAESLWLKSTNDERGLVARKVASRVGDIVTVNVSESVTFSTDGVNMSTEGKTSGLQTEAVRILNAVVFDKFDLGHDEDGNPINLDLGALLRGDYDGGAGSISTDLSIDEIPITVQVIDVLPNGNLVIEGARTVSVAGERLYAVLRGIIRVADIDTENTIESSRVANATIEFISEGSLSDVQKKGWLTNFFDSANPF